MTAITVAMNGPYKDGTPEDIAFASDSQVTCNGYVYEYGSKLLHQDGSSLFAAVSGSWAWQDFFERKVIPNERLAPVNPDIIVNMLREHASEHNMKWGEPPDHVGGARALPMEAFIACQETKAVWHIDVDLSLMEISRIERPESRPVVLAAGSGDAIAMAAMYGYMECGSRDHGVVRQSAELVAAIGVAAAIRLQPGECGGAVHTYRLGEGYKPKKK